MSGQTYRLVRRGGTGRASAPVLDEHQRAVVEHPGGPLLVLAGPGTGKTTTIVESVVAPGGAARRRPRARARAHLQPQGGGRAARPHHRAGCAAPPARRSRSPSTATPTRCCAASAVLAGEPPPRLLTGPEQLLEVRRLLHGELEDGAPGTGRADMRELLKTRGFAEELRDFLARAAERGLDGARPDRAGPPRTAGTTGWRPGGSPSATPPGSTWTRCRRSTTPS